MRIGGNRSESMPHAVYAVFFEIVGGRGYGVSQVSGQLYGFKKCLPVGLGRRGYVWTAIKIA